MNYWIAIVLGVCGVTLGASHLSAQCTGGTFAGSLTPTVPWKTVPCVRGGEYYEFSAVAGNYYTFTFCMAGGNALWNTEATMLDNAGVPVSQLGVNNNACGLGADVRYWGPAPYTGTFRILITESDGVSNFCLSNSLCATMAYKQEVTPFTGPGANCATANNIVSLPYTGGGLSTCFQFSDYTPSASNCNSPYLFGEDYVFTYNGTANECLSIYLRNTFIYTGVFLLDGCPDQATTNCIAFDEAGAGDPVLSNITLPSTGTYYIVVSTFPSPNCTPFDIEVVNCVAVGQGDTCANAFPIPAIPYANVGFTTCGFGNDYNSTQVCASDYLDGEDFVFQYTSAGNECVAIELSGTSSWTGFHVLDGCPDNPASNCIASRGEPGGNPRLRRVEFTSPGTYYIVVSTFPAPNCTPFNISLEPCTAACTRNTNLADVCGTATPVSLTLGDTICGFSDFSFTPDTSPDLDAAFCGSIENNGWFSFVADSTALTLQFEIGNCLTGFGVQAQIFETSNCNNFTALSTCFNPQIQANGFLQATGLTPGNTYLLMIDGYAGDDCEFIAYRVGGLLPVEWGPFTATLDDENDVYLDWATFSETNAQGFYVQRGQSMVSPEDNAIRWETIGYLEAQGNDPDGHAYQYIDREVEFNGDSWYYRLQQIDFNGTSDFSEVREVGLDGPDRSALLRIYPNPAVDAVNLSYYIARDGAVRFHLFNLAGQIVRHVNLAGGSEGTYQERVDLADLPSGLYIYDLTIGTKSMRGKIEVMR
ncbi:MAG: T9SS type A sorting domain-containing protein [Bacteroidota bacterium]